MGLTDKLKAIGDGFRSSRNITGGISLDQMAELAMASIGGGTKEIICKSGMYTATSVDPVTIEHNLGINPDIIIIRRCDSQASAATFFGAIGFTDSLGDQIKFYSYPGASGSPSRQIGFGSSPFISHPDSIHSNSLTSPIRDANSTHVTVGSSHYYKHTAGMEYAWWVIGGLT